MIGSANGRRIGITGLGVNVLTSCNVDLEQFVDTTDEVDRRAHGHPRAALRDPGAGAHRHRRPGGRDRSRRGRRGRRRSCSHRGHGDPGQRCSRPAARRCSPTRSRAGRRRYDLLAGCTGFMYALAQAYAMVAAGSRRALVVGDVLSEDRLGGPLDARPLRRRARCGRARASRQGRLSRLRARCGRRRRQEPPGCPAARSRHFERGQAGEDERPRGLQVRDTRHGQLRAEGAGRDAD